MKTPLKIGDRIAVYFCSNERGSPFRAVEPAYATRFYGIISKLAPGCVQVNNSDWFSVKQCRRIKQKKKPSEIWIKTSGAMSCLNGRLEQTVVLGSLGITNVNHEWLLFREVVRK